MANYGIIVTGQSLAVGGGRVNGYPNYGIEDNYDPNIVMIGEHPIGNASENLGTTVNPLREEQRDYVNDILATHTVAHSLTRWVFDEVEDADKVSFCGQAWGGKNMDSIQQGGESGVFEKNIGYYQAHYNDDNTLNSKYVCLIHGEQDGVDNNTLYDIDINNLRIMYQNEMNTITGRSDVVKLLTCQTNTATAYGFYGLDNTDFPTPLEQIQSHSKYGNVFLVTPKYFLPYRDRVHIDNDGERILGEYYGKAIKQIEKVGYYQPLIATHIETVGSTFIINIDGNVGDLQFDTINVKKAENFGFEYSDVYGNTIKTIFIDELNRINIEITGNIPPGAVLGYAYRNGDYGADSDERGEIQRDGRGTRGNIRDSDMTPSKYEPDRILYNWLMAFRYVNYRKVAIIRSGS